MLLDRYQPSQAFYLIKGSTMDNANRAQQPLALYQPS